MELRQLRYFLAVARTLNFTKAAQEVHIAQPPLSRQINNLEEELGVRLFERSTRGITLTPAGLFFQDRASEVLMRIERLKRETAAFHDNPRPTIRIAFDQSALYGRAPAVFRYLRTFYTANDFVFTEVTSADQARALRDGDIDFSVGRVVTQDEQIRHVTVREEPFMLALEQGHPACPGDGRALRLADLRGETFILYGDRANARSLDPVLRFFDITGFKPARTIAIGDLSAALGLVAGGVGVSVVPSTAKLMRTADVAYVDLDEPGAVSPIVLSVLHTSDQQMMTDILAELRRLSALTGPRVTVVSHP